MDVVFEFDIDFSDRLGPVLHYKGYRPTHDEFLKAGGPYSKYFQDKVGPNEMLITTSYHAVPDNLELDDRVKAFMRDNELTLCEACYPHKQMPKMPFDVLVYAVNYSFDNYKTFGFITMSSMRAGESRRRTMK